MNILRYGLGFFIQLALLLALTVSIFIGGWVLAVFGVAFIASTHTEFAKKINSVAIPMKVTVPLVVALTVFVHIAADVVTGVTF